MYRLLALLLAPGSAQPPAEPFVHHVQTVRVCRATTDAPLPPRTPDACRPMRTERVDPQGTALWLLSEVTVPASHGASREPLAVLVQSMASTAIYWDGVLISRSGTVSGTAARETAGQFVHVAPLRSDELAPGVHRLAVHLSSHRGPVHVQMPVHVIGVAPLTPIAQGVGAASPATLLALGALLLAAVYFGTVARRLAPWREAALVAVMMACAMLQGAAELWRAFWPLTYVEQIWRLMLILTAAVGLGAALVAYITRRFAPAWQRRALLGYTLLAGLMLLVPSFDLRTLLVLASAAAITTVVAGHAAWRGRRDARPVSVVLLLLSGVAALEWDTFLDRELFVGLTVLTIVLLVDHVAQLQRLQLAAAASRQQVERLELELLRRRLTPHWLLNMLNALAAWIEEEPTTAVRMVGMLGEEFHRLAHPVDARVIPMQEELTACHRLLELMSLRSGRTYCLDAAGVSPTQAVPPGVLHTLVENALTHGRYPHGATFVIRQHTDHGTTVLTFAAPRADRPAATDHREDAADGFGLTYVRARLAAAFGETATLRHGPDGHGGWATILRLGTVAT